MQFDYDRDSSGAIYLYWKCDNYEISVHCNEANAAQNHYEESNA